MQRINEFIIDYNFIGKFEVDSLKKHLLLPLYEDEVYSYCAICKESDLEFSKKCFFNLIKYVEISKSELLFYLSSFKIRHKLYNHVLKSNVDELNHLNINEFLEEFLFFSIQKRASDIHIESQENNLLIRFRIDGKLKHFFTFPKYFYKMLSSLIKLHCNLDITQFRKPMDARMSYSFDEVKYDFRVSILPIIKGESIVIRILDNKEVEKNLNSLEFSPKLQNALLKVKDLTQGLVLVCGPTGSGKTTTLYSLINSMDLEGKKIITVEDPVEYKIEGIQQVVVDEKQEMSFSNILRNILRQDPDVIFIGEIRDVTSLKIAIQASLTGHLVLSTIHSSSALNSLSRLLQLEAEGFLLASTLKSIFYQRLVLKVCPHCNFQGCSKCNYTKYLGRTTIGEVINMNEEIAKLLTSNSSMEDIKIQLKKDGFETILEDAKQKAKRGITALDEIYRVLGFEDEV